MGEWVINASCRKAVARGPEIRGDKVKVYSDITESCEAFNKNYGCSHKYDNLKNSRFCISLPGNIKIRIEVLDLLHHFHVMKSTKEGKRRTG